METVTGLAGQPAFHDRVVAPLRDWRRPLHAGLSSLTAAAEAVAAGDPADALRALDRALAYLRGTLLPACDAEEFTLFIAVDGVYGATGAVAVMRAQHQVIAEMTADLEKVVAYGLARGHLESEDAAYLTVLDEHLSESQVNVIVENLDRIVSAKQAPKR